MIIDDDKVLDLFFTCINLCHECVCTLGKGGKTDFTGPSTDEICFLEMARDVKDWGFFHDRDSENIRIELPSGVKNYKVLKYFGFTSDRKASSVVVQD